MYDELVKELQELSHEYYLDDRDVYTEAKLKEAADAIEELDGLLYEAERDRDEYRERLDKTNDAIEELQKAVNFHKFNSEFWEYKYNSLADENWTPVEEALPQPPREVE